MPAILSRREFLRLGGGTAGAVIAAGSGALNFFSGVYAASAQSYTDPVIASHISSSTVPYVSTTDPFTGLSIDLRGDFIDPALTLVADFSRNVRYYLKDDQIVEDSFETLVNQSSSEPFYKVNKDSLELEFVEPINMVKVGVSGENVLVVVGSHRQPEDVLKLGDIKIPRIEITPNTDGINENYGMRFLYGAHTPRNVIVNSFDKVMLDFKNSLPSDVYISSAALKDQTFIADDSDPEGVYKLYDSDHNLVLLNAFFNLKKVYLFDAADSRKQWLIQDPNVSYGMTDIVNAAANLEAIMQTAPDSEVSFVPRVIASIGTG